MSSDSIQHTGYNAAVSRLRISIHHQRRWDSHSGTTIDNVPASSNTFPSFHRMPKQTASSQHYHAGLKPRWASCTPYTVNTRGSDGSICFRSFSESAHVVILPVGCACRRRSLGVPTRRDAVRAVAALVVPLLGLPRHRPIEHGHPRDRVQVQNPRR